MKSYQFKVEGVKLFGYIQGRREAHNPGRVRFKNLVRHLANIAGVPDVLAPRPAYARVIVEIYWRKLSRIDGKNVLGLVEDALWAQDRLIRFGAYESYENHGEEYAQVFVKILKGTPVES